MNLESKRKSVSKKFGIGIGITIIVLLIVAYLSPNSTYFSHFIIIKASPDDIMNVLSKPKNFNLWNPWFGYDTAVVYQTAYTPSADEADIIYWTSPNNFDLSGNLVYQKEADPNKLRIIANYGRQGNGIFNFSVNYSETGKTILRLEYFTEFGVNPLNRLNGLFARYWLKDDLKFALSKLKSAIESNPELRTTPIDLVPERIDSDMISEL